MSPVCGSCPWNRRSTLGYWDPAHLIGIAYACSAAIPVGTMACHQWNGSYSPNRTPANAAVCGGWLRVAPQAGAVRLGVAKGFVDPADCANKDGHELYTDPATMLRWNGIRPEMLPPLDPPEGGPEVVTEWVNSLILLAGQMRVSPETACVYVIARSPSWYGVHDNGATRVPMRRLVNWRRECEEWEARRRTR